jgi:hypothetical protein
LAGQVLEISKHESTAKTRPSGLTGQCARVYRFPSRTVAVVPAPPIPKRRRVSNFRIHLVVELTIGLLFWLVWFIWHLMH